LNEGIKPRERREEKKKRREEEEKLPSQLSA
jgi:hypothetical protein